MKIRLLLGLILSVSLMFAVACQDSQNENSAETSNVKNSSTLSSFEVWAVDQSGTSSDPNADFGGLIYIWDGKSISDNASTASPEIIDLAIAASEAGCNSPKKPHMVLSNYSSPKPSHMILANVGSGDTFFINIDTHFAGIEF